ncbi:ABC transporter ATP-binding protein [Comamonas endophytica]|uniref:ABC transporter ATP-binding protein n=1 Tax=Comamonas endophytica TaxID=2949090 RepID=A0ABY6G998_9BURK|nr:MULTISPECIES: ABC transporter ATP-binding protein [unclassified Acidovorax]MCD2511908.1 ABC transporter ATP-binding protein [Acidovorax sp. D4N7]UYG51626.1 ABC transporter ATP-binding protein [Acidovorax sp. 5MLIR]
MSHDSIASALPHEAAPVLEVKDLHTQFDTRAGVLPVVNGVGFRLHKGKVLGLVGESGSGKSVTGFSIMGLLDAAGRISAGEVLFQGQDLAKLDARALRSLRGNRMAMIFQDPMATLNPVLRIDVQMLETIRAHRRMGKLEALEHCRKTLARMGIPSPAERLKAYPHQLSGGMRQRVAIAIALLNDPELIIADEPTTALDVTIQAQILSEMQQLVRETGTAMIWISHDLSVVAGLADDIAVMYAGRIVEHGSVDDVLDNPQHPYTQGLIGSLPSANQRQRRLQQISGMAPNLLDLPPGCAFAPRCPRAQPRCQEPPALEPVAAAGDTTATVHTVRCFFPGAAPELSRSAA